MRVYAGMDPQLPLADVAAHAQRVESLGYDGLRVPETIHDGLMVALLALEHTTRLHVSTSIILAFPRSPMVVAYAAWDLQRMSGGRFTLGLGTQVRGNIEGRFSVPWVAPIEKLREYLLALRTIWRAFQDGTGVDFEGEHYRFTRLQPYFNPGPIEHPQIPLLLGGVNPRICRLAGELADELATHPTNSSPRYLRELILPALAKGAERAQRTTTSCALLAGSPVITGRTEEHVARAREAQRQMLAFLYSTPAYWPTLELNGWGDLGRRLRALTREDRWDEMADAVGDEVIDQLVPQGTYDEIAEILVEWYGGLAEAVSLPLPEDPADDQLAARVISQLQAAGA